jgi:hypothetical protein
MSNGTLNSFISYFNNHNLTGVMSTFCQDDKTTNPNAPCVGITDHGPAFILRNDVSTLFQQLFSTFQNLTWNPVQATWAQQTAAMPSWAGTLGPVTNEVAVQFWLTGKYQNDWFQSGQHASPPLSNLHNYQHGQNLGRYRGDKTGMGLPGVAFFSFDSGANIRQLQIYIDRYALMQSITQNKGDWDAPGGN